MSTGDTPVNSPEIRRLARVLEPGHNYASVTDKIASIVLTRPTSIGWLAGFGLSFGLKMSPIQVLAIGALAGLFWRAPAEV